MISCSFAEFFLPGTEGLLSVRGEGMVEGDRDKGVRGCSQRELNIEAKSKVVPKV